MSSLVCVGGEMNNAHQPAKLHVTAFAVPSSVSSIPAGILQAFMADEVVQVLTSPQ